jgi:hypothetical protein
MVMNWSSAPRTTPSRRSSDRRYLHHDTILQGAHHAMSHQLSIRPTCNGSQARHAARCRPSSPYLASPAHVSPLSPILSSIIYPTSTAW